MLLTAKKRLIVHLIGQGLSNDEIAQHTLISKESLKKHITSLLEQTGTKNRSALVNYAWENNILPIPEHLNPQSISNASR
jgi:DNA-binding CsgD family transcriptional regulator